MTKDKKRGFFSWLGLGRQDDELKQNEELQQDAEQLSEGQTVNDEIQPVEDERVAEVTAELNLEQTAESGAPPETYDDPLTPLVEPHAAAFQVINTGGQINETGAVTASDDEVETARVENAKAAYDDIDIVDEPDIDEAELESDVETALALNSAESQDEHDEFEFGEQHEQDRPTKEGFFARLKRSLLRTKENLGSGFIGLFLGKRIDDELFEELEEQLLIADVGVGTTSKIIASLTQHATRKDLKDAEALYGKLKEEMGEILAKVDVPLDVTGHKPFVILMVGVNGVGKTTTIGKLARQFQAEGKSVMLAAGDTFRAAAVEQLQVWGQRNKIPVIAQHTGADSASVIFDAIQAAHSRGVDVLIADTAGRLQNKSHLMEELKKIVRVMKKLDENAPHEIMLTIDASTGQNAISQTKLFNEAIGVTGIALTKLDGTAKGGVIFSVADQFGIPIRYIGVGEGIEDLRPFKADDFIEALFARED
ncbi:signal recognition particle-docking protein FtsY [Budvicia diplopodorum]|uniref:signal recognition particle-docking protein FtsY n=1 Tax=Budvicia diplopodorum TaxID=1119056 RepID=UPI001357DDA2|nr:signal recognition particle-docking protein FtsY [Budvicia diplopodorum]